MAQHPTLAHHRRQIVEREHGVHARQGAGGIGMNAADGGVRMESGEITAAEVVRAVLADTRIRDAAERCALLAKMAKPGDRFDPDDLRATGCSETASGI